MKRQRLLPLVGILTTLPLLGVAAPAQAAPSLSWWLSAPNAVVAPVSRTAVSTASGSLSRPPTGAAVALQRWTGSAWVQTARVVPKSGRFQVSTGPLQAGFYRFRTVVLDRGGHTLVAAAARPLRVWPSPKTITWAGPTSVAASAGTKTANPPLSGTVVKTPAATSALLQRRTARGWVTTARATVSGSRFAARAGAVPVGSHEYRALGLDRNGHAVVASATTTVRVIPAAGTTRRAHFTVNLSGQYAGAAADGFTVFDVAGSTSHPASVEAKLDALPAGTKAMVWVGNLDNSSAVPGFTLAQFKAQVDALAADPRVYGYFLADEPHPGAFPAAAAEIRARADYIRAHAPAQKSFIVVLDGTNTCGGTLGCEYSALAPAHTHVDLVGIDSYPCHLGAPCDDAKITERVAVARRSGIPDSAMVPTYQAFGQEGKAAGAYYRTPTPAELTSMLATWDAALPHAVMDYAYSWGTQTTSPQALSNHPELQQVVRAHNAR